MAPRYGRAYGGTRAIISAPYQHGHQITMISAISIQQVEAAMYGQWAANSHIFSHFLENNLQAQLTAEHVVIMDNVSFHKTNSVRKIIESVGAKLIYLPPYHPEFNPIEEMWSKIKTCLRKLSPRNLGAFQKSIKYAFEAVSQSDLMGWFEHAGYGS